jgi:hypothetical protein
MDLFESAGEENHGFNKVCLPFGYLLLYFHVPKQQERIILEILYE